MKLQTFAVICLLLVACLGLTPRDAGQQPAPVTVVVAKGADGKTLGFSQVREHASLPADPIHWGMYLPGQQDVKDADGVHVSGFGLNAWRDAGVVHVRVSTLVPRPGAPNRYLAGSGDNPMEMLRPRPLVSFTLAPGTDRPVVEMERFGVTPVTLSLDSLVPGEVPAQ